MHSLLCLCVIVKVVVVCREQQRGLPESTTAKLNDEIWSNMNGGGNKREVRYKSKAP